MPKTIEDIVRDLDEFTRMTSALLEQLPPEIPLPGSMRQSPMERREIMIAVPTLDGKVESRFMVAICDAITAVRERGHACWVKVFPYCVYLSMVRSKAATEFLESTATDLFFIDADEGFTVDGFLRVLDATPEIVGGVPPFKHDVAGFPGLYLTDDAGKPLYDGGLGLIEYAILGTGFMRIRRAALERFVAHYGEESLRIVEVAADGSERARYLGIFDTHKAGTTWYGEDVHFCHLWREMGGRLWVDPFIEFTHTGTKTWSGSLDAHLRTLPGGVDDPAKMRTSAGD